MLLFLLLSHSYKYIALQKNEPWSNVKSRYKNEAKRLRVIYYYRKVTRAILHIWDALVKNPMNNLKASKISLRFGCTSIVSLFKLFIYLHPYNILTFLLQEIIRICLLLYLRPYMTKSIDQVPKLALAWNGIAATSHYILAASHRFFIQLRHYGIDQFYLCKIP